MECGELEVAIADYLAGSADAAQSAVVEAHLAGCAACRETVSIWRRLEELPLEEEPAPGLASRFRRQLRARPMLSSRWLAAAAALLVGVLSFFGGRASVAERGIEKSKDSDLASLHREVRNLREVGTLSLLDQQSASERLRGIRYSTAIEGYHPEVAAALTRTLPPDSRDDVRPPAA